MASRFLTKKSLSNQNLPYEMLNTGFPFLYSSNINNRPAGFFLAFGLSCLPPKRSAERSRCNGLLFPGNLDPSSLTPGGPVVLLVCGFRRRDNNLLAWRELFVNLYELKSRIRFWRNTTTLNEFIGYIDLINFRQISPKHSRNNYKRERAGKF